MAKTIAQLQSLSYRELQAECKAEGVSAKGKAEELLGRLIQKLQQDDPKAEVPAATPTPAKKTAARTQTKQASAVTPSPRKSLDKKVVARAMTTPLPVSPAAKTHTHAAATPRAAAPRRAESKLATWAPLLGVVLVVLLYSPMAYKLCQRNATCSPKLQKLESSLRTDFTALSAFTKQHVGRVQNSAKYYATVVAEMARKGPSRQLQQLLEKLRPAGGEPGRKSAFKQVEEFNGKLNTAVLQTVLRQDQGSAWEELHLSLNDAWNGGKISADQDKANTVLFACGNAIHCDESVADLSAAAPVEALLILSPVDFKLGKGELQNRLIKFFILQPRGVVIIPNVDRVPTDFLSVLNTVMGEYGALTINGHSVKTTEGTFLLTWQAPPAVMAEDSETSFTLAAKRDLTLLLRGKSDDEATLAVVDAFRRRIDLVAPMKEVEDEYAHYEDEEPAASQPVPAPAPVAADDDEDEYA